MPKILNDCRRPETIEIDHKQADKYATRGTVMHFALRLGFMPHNEEQAEQILERIVREHEFLETFTERL